MEVLYRGFELWSYPSATTFLHDYLVWPRFHENPELAPFEPSCIPVVTEPSQLTQEFDAAITTPAQKDFQNQQHTYTKDWLIDHAEANPSPLEASTVPCTWRIILQKSPKHQTTAWWMTRETLMTDHCSILFFSADYSKFHFRHCFGLGNWRQESYSIFWTVSVHLLWRVGRCRHRRQSL